MQIQKYYIFTFNRDFHVVLELSSKVNKRGYDSINMKQRQYIKKCTSNNAPIVHLIHLFSTFFGNDSSIVHITLVTQDHLFNIFICMLKLPRKFYFSYQSVRRSNQSESWTLSQHAMTVPIEKGKHKVMERSKNFGLSQVSLLFYWFMFTFLCRFFLLLILHLVY